ncbi:MAG: electron transfer flavoprotein subunit alpha/FixB family protein [Gammaproteobacteria bacterium]|nr:electron transfer flavoprotein subunit alpha/FixB family protein [Gammaproteobacteria bacterium]
MKTLLIVEHNNESLNASTFSMLSAAMLLPSIITVLIAGSQCEPLTAFFKKNEKIEKVILLDSPDYQTPLAEDLAALIVKLAPEYDYVLAPASTFGKNILPRAAAILGLSMLSDVLHIHEADLFTRPIYAGNVLETVRLKEKIKFLTLRPSSFSPMSMQGEAVPVEKIADPIVHERRAQFIDHELTVYSRPELQSARTIIAGGRGLQNKENFKLIEQLADKLGAAVGASRAAVDAGFISNDFQIGQTGKVVAPDLYIAVGISGAIQHLAGMKNSKVVVAINKDPDAPIFQGADYGLVGDLFEIVPQLIAELDKD